MAEAEFKTGEVSFQVDSIGKPCKTWYKVFGSLHSGRRPLVTLHGGPGASHDYILPIAALASRYSIPVVFYDQLGTGQSTHLPETKGDEAFWTEDLFCAELDNLVAHLGISDDFDLYGHSWGGMLAARYATKQPKGLKRLIISDSPASMKLWLETAQRYLDAAPREISEPVRKHEAAGTYEEKEYLDAVDKLNALHTCRVEPMPQELVDSFGWISRDPTVYHTMNGPSEYCVIGSLKSWDITPELFKITVSTLLLNGKYDGASDDAMLPYLLGITGSVKWVNFAQSSHTPQWEEPEKYIKVVGEFLTKVV